MGPVIVVLHEMQPMNSSGGKERLGGITKQGDRYLRQLLVIFFASSCFG